MLSDKDKFTKGMFDLIYLDPPFNSNANYNMFFKSKTGKASEAQILAFSDTWEWTAESEATLDKLRKSRIGDVVTGLERVVGHSDMLAYVVSMAVRLLELHRVLKETGSIFVHCDPTASHYLKIVMDAIFTPRNFRNELVWKRSTSSQKGSQHEPRRFGRNHDVILFYVKNDRAAKFYPIKKPPTQEQIDAKFRHVDERGRWMDNSSHIWSTPNMGARPNLCYEWRGFRNKHPSGWRLSRERLEEEYQKGNFEIVKKNGKRKLIRKIYLKDYKGENTGDLWDDINPAQGKERVGYPTQKPEDLLERIIKATTEEGDLVLDPFCGCGTTVMSAERLGRSWVGMDITHLAVDLIAKRISDSYSASAVIHGVPESMDAAVKLADDNKLEFEKWAVTRIPNVYPNQRQVGDSGVDGRGLIEIVGEDGKKRNETVIVSVKGGRNIVPGMVRDLIGTIRSTHAGFGVFICLRRPTKKTEEAAAKAGVFTNAYGTWPRCVIYTIEDYFAGKRPRLVGLMDLTKAERKQRVIAGTQTSLDSAGESV